MYVWIHLLSLPTAPTASSFDRHLEIISLVALTARLRNAYVALKPPYALLYAYACTTTVHNQYSVHLMGSGPNQQIRNISYAMIYLPWNQFSPVYFIMRYLGLPSLDQKTTGQQVAFSLLT